MTALGTVSSGATAPLMLPLRPVTTTGRLLAVEGTDGAGKTTFIHGLVRELQTRGMEVVVTAQPSPGIRATEVFRGLAETAAPDESLYRALYMITLGDRLYHTRMLVEPALDCGKLVVCDRYIYTTVANMLARGHRAEAWFLEAAAHLPRPHLALLLHCPVEEALRRIRSRSSERDRQIDVDHLSRTRQAFLQLADLGFMQAVDSSVATPEEIRAQVLNWLAKELGADGR